MNHEDSSKVALDDKIHMLLNSERLNTRCVFKIFNNFSFKYTFRENQHVSDRSWSLLSVGDLISDLFDFLGKKGILNETFVFYSIDHGCKQGQWRIGTSKQHPYEV